MTGAMVIVKNGTPLQPLIAMLIQMIFLLVVLKMAPYNDDLDYWSSFICSLALMLTTLAGFLLMISNKNLDPILSNEPQKEMNMLTTSLIGINALSFMYEMVVIGYVVCREKCSRKKKKVQVLPVIDDDSKDTSNTFTRVTPGPQFVAQSDLAELKHWGHAGEENTGDNGKVGVRLFRNEKKDENVVVDQEEKEVLNAKLSQQNGKNNMSTNELKKKKKVQILPVKDDSNDTGKSRLFNKEQKDNNDREEKEKKDNRDKAEKEALYQQYGKKGKGLIRKSTILL